MSAERHAIELAHNTLQWLLAEGDLSVHPGLRSTLTSAEVQLVAAGRLLPASPKEDP